jgi:hypothetical protein
VFATLLSALEILRYEAFLNRQYERLLEQLRLPSLRENPPTRVAYDRPLTSANPQKQEYQTKPSTYRKQRIELLESRQITENKQLILKSHK